VQGVRSVISTLTNDGREVMGPGVLVSTALIAMVTSFHLSQVGGAPIVPASKPL
jgi:hypothetical protein